jgi:hypothetical protein
MSGQHQADYTIGFSFHQRPFFSKLLPKNQSDNTPLYLTVKSTEMQLDHPIYTWLNTPSARL